MLMSSGGIPGQYQVVQMVFGFASATEGCNGVINSQAVYQMATQRLVESATAAGASGVLFVGFQNRVAVSRGCSGPKQAFEVFAWGTAVRF